MRFVLYFWILFWAWVMLGPVDSHIVRNGQWDAVNLAEFVCMAQMWIGWRWARALKVAQIQARRSS